MYTLFLYYMLSNKLLFCSYVVIYYVITIGQIGDCILGKSGQITNQNYKDQSHTIL